jgi:hypothetical protein
VSARKAENLYKSGFKQTNEELTKQKCNEILNRIQLNNEEVSETGTTAGAGSTEEESVSVETNEMNEKPLQNTEDTTPMTTAVTTDETTIVEDESIHNQDSSSCESLVDLKL